MDDLGDLAGVALGVVAAEVLEMFDDDDRWDQPAVIAEFAVSETPEGAMLAVTSARQLDGHPRAALHGTRAESSAAGVALVFEAWVTAADQSMPFSASQAADRVEVRSCLVALRDGTHTSVVHERNGGTRSQDNGGPLVDTLLRMLGAPTPPPAENAGTLLALHTWLGNVAAHAEEARRPPFWGEAVEILFPRTDFEALGVDPADTLAVAFVVSFLETIGDVEDIEAVFADAVSEVPELDWFDVGSFSRAFTAATFSTYSDAFDTDARRHAIDVWQAILGDRPDD